MAKRAFRPEDGYRLKTAAEPDLSPDGRRVAFVVADVDEEKDRLRSSIWVVATDGASPPRRFTEGPSDRSPAWSPDGRWLAYISVTDDKPHHAHVRIAPLDGGEPARLGDLPGPVLQLAWSPDSGRLAVVCRVGGRNPEADGPDKHAPRAVRGLAARIDGIGWYEGRRHVFVVEVEDGAARRLTRGDYDHADPSFSPDGSSLVFVSDRHPRRDDRELRSDVWRMPSTGGRPVRLTGGQGFAAAPQFSPDGNLVAFGGRESDTWDLDAHLFVVPAEGGGVRRVAPRLDRPMPVMLLLPVPFRWWGERELAFLAADRGCVRLHVARVGEAGSREVVGTDTQISGLSVRPGRREAVFTAVWPDRPSELFATTRTGGEPVQLSHLHEDLLDEVELSPAVRMTITRPDGTEVDYFSLRPPTPRSGTSRSGISRSKKPPLHLDIHGGPHGWWPSGRGLAFHQSIAGAGYAVVLPNPRGSAGYGQAFTSACTGDWGGADFEDILACCDDAVRRGFADAGRAFVHGYSYGGFMTAWAVGHTDRFRAATAAAAVIDQESMALTTDVPHFAAFNMLGTPWKSAGEYEKRSPLTYLPDVTTPVLVLHWEGDIRVPIGQGEELFAGLRLLGKEAAFVRYPGGFHVMHTPSQDVDWVRQVLAWNEQHDTRRTARVR
jgi:dipeptidyl aminopeptidase/acylaminoacyl peptidase